MFENDYTIYGKHATYIKELVNNTKLFSRYIDVYMTGAVFGLLYNRKSSKDNNIQDRARIYADAFSNCRDQCIFLYRLSMILADDGVSALTSNSRIDRAFRFDSDERYKEELENNLNLFNSFVLGGIEVLYEKILENTIIEKDYINKGYELMENFLEELQDLSYEEEINKLINK